MKYLWEFCPSDEGRHIRKGGGKMVRGKRLSSVVLAVAVLAALVGSCGNPLEGGSEPSGSILRVMGVTASSSEQDLFFCEGTQLTFATADVTIRNDSTPNFEPGPLGPERTNSFVTMDRYRIDYAILNMSGTLPGLDGGGFTVGIDVDTTGTVTVLLITEPILEFIRSNFPTVGNGQAMVVRADITLWGKDAFLVDVSTRASVTLTIDDFNPCLSDIVPPDEESL